MAVAKRNIEEIGESLENMGKNDRPSLLNTEVAKSEEEKNTSKGGRKRRSSSLLRYVATLDRKSVV